jgi:hypothetical protein
VVAADARDVVNWEVYGDWENDPVIVGAPLLGEVGSGA